MEAMQDLEVEEGEEAFDHRDAWRNHFASFFGMAPEKHWLFSGRRFKHWASGDRNRPGHFNPFVAMVMSKGGGLLSLFVLHLLHEKPRYGNNIMREIEDRTRGRWGANPGAIYPLLTKMEERDLINGTWEDPKKRTRRIYHLTPSGKQELGRLKEVMRPKLAEAINVLRSLNKELDIDLEA
jgi:DNA-binding PadR family transcriptional regulator